MSVRATTSWTRFHREEVAPYRWCGDVRQGTRPMLWPSPSRWEELSLIARGKLHFCWRSIAFFFSFFFGRFILSPGILKMCCFCFSDFIFLFLWCLHETPIGLCLILWDVRSHQSDRSGVFDFRREASFGACYYYTVITTWQLFTQTWQLIVQFTVNNTRNSPSEWSEVVHEDFCLISLEHSQTKKEQLPFTQNMT